MIWKIEAPLSFAVLALLLIAAPIGASGKEAPAAGHEALNPAMEEARKGVMVSIKGGCFDMGGLFGEAYDDERPVHRVCLDDFKLDKYEVTRAAYGDAPRNASSTGDGCPGCTATQVSWEEANGYCARLGRPPTEAEWE